MFGSEKLPPGQYSMEPTACTVVVVLISPRLYNAALQRSLFTSEDQSYVGNEVPYA